MTPDSTQNIHIALPIPNSVVYSCTCIYCSTPKPNKMHFSTLSIALLTFTTILTSASPMRRQSDLAATVLSDISTLGADVSKLTSEVNSFDGGLIASLGVITAETALDVQILKTTATVKHSAAFNSTEGQSIVLALAGLITPISDSLTAISDKVRIKFRAASCEGFIMMYEYTSLG